MQQLTNDNIARALKLAGVDGFSGKSDELGGGEVNNTYKLYFDSKQIIMRIAKDEGQQTLINEAKAISLYSDEHIPKLVYFDKNSKINNRLWILETYISGRTVERLSAKQFYNLGCLLAVVHTQPSSGLKIKLRKQFIESCRAFGDERFLLNHPDEQLQKLIRSAFVEFDSVQQSYEAITPTLIHSDATPSNVLVDGDEVSLIDWEFSKYSDPMCDFSTIYYEDIEYNKGKWRIKITQDEKKALFSGYITAGGEINEERIKFWIKFDKLGVAVFLYWRIHQSSRTTSDAEVKQYKLDYNNLIASLTTGA